MLFIDGVKYSLWTRSIDKGWFFKTGQEKEFKITDKNKIDYAMELIKQSYELAK